jgi:hypothetical protein
METLEIAVVVKNIETGLAAFESRKAELTTKVSGYDSLAIKDHADKKGYQEVSTARKSLKAERVQIEKEGKSMRDPLTAMSKYIIGKETELVQIVEPSEKKLADMEKWYDSENERIDREAAEKEATRIQGMADQLTAYNFPFNIEQLKTVTPEQFNEALAFAKEAFETKEAERIAFEKAEAERKAAEEEQLRKDREELAALRAQQEETARVQREAQALIDAENKRIADEKAAIEREKQNAIEAKRRADELEAAKKKAAEEARLKAIADAKAAEEKKQEAERKAQAAAEKKARLAPDKDKLLAFHDRIGGLVDFEVKSPEAQQIVTDIKLEITRMQNWIKQRSEQL